LDLRPVRFLAVGHGQSVGVALGKEAGVSATVVADRDGSSAEVDHLDEVGMAGLVIWVVVVASMDRVDGAGGHRRARVVCRARHRVLPCGGGVSGSRRSRMPRWDRVPIERVGHVARRVFSD
jgi:hypothetical protein